MVRKPRVHEGMPVGIVLQRSPGATRWERFRWALRAVLPGAGPAQWVEMRRDDEIIEFHAGTMVLDLFGTDTEAYLHELQTRDPSVYVILRRGTTPEQMDLVHVTVSPYEAQDYADSGEEIIEKISMPAPIRAWVEDFVATHHQETPFVKRKRDKKRVDLAQDGIGDARISDASDVYASPRLLRERLA